MRVDHRDRTALFRFPGFMPKFIPILRFLLVPVAGILICLPSLAQDTAQTKDTKDTVLMSNSLAEVTRRDYDAELSRLPPDIREAFSNDPRRVHDLLSRMLLQKSLAAQARAARIDQTPENAARIAFEMDRLLASMEIAVIERDAGAEFDANVARYEARARELYLVNKDAYTNPPEVRAAHILFDTKEGKHTPEAAQRKAEEARARLAAGTDFATLAREVSDDRVSGEAGGELGWFAQKQMDPAFWTAAFALQKPGDISPPVRSSFGWHIIKLEDKRPATVQPYSEARAKILAELRQRFVSQKRDAAFAAIRSDPKTTPNTEAIDALVPKVDLDAARREQGPGRPVAPPPK